MQELRKKNHSKKIFLVGENLCFGRFFQKKLFLLTKIVNDRVFDCEGVIGGVGSQVPEVLLLSADMIRPMKTLTLIDKAKKRPKTHFE